MPTKQETFDTVVAHLRKQGTRSLNHNDEEMNGVVGCAYRGLEGRMCAAGCLIPDLWYAPIMEGKRCGHGLVGQAMRVLGHDIQLVSRLQSIHDTKPVSTWEQAFATTADLNGIVYTPPTKEPISA